MKKIGISIILIFGTIGSIKAQSFNNILTAGKQDASKYLENYLEPVMIGLVQNLNSGWYHTGKTHKKYGFDFTINASATFTPNDAQQFMFNNIDYTVLELANGNNSENLPTVMGGTTTQQINVRVPLDALGNEIPAGSTTLPTSFKIAKFNALDGIVDELPIAAVPSTMVQIGFGLPSKTDIKLRFISSVGNDEVKFNLIGFGLQHNILQYLKLDKTIFDVSVLGAFTTSTTKYVPKNSTIPGTNQETKFKINAYTFQVLGNVNLKIINFYAGLGYAGGTSSTKVNGTYTFDYDIQNTIGNVINTVSEEIIDPINIEHKMDKQLRATLGMRLNLAFFKIFADYTVQDYKTFNAGIALSFR